MLFLVVSTPHPSRPADVADARRRIWPWIAGLQAQGKIICFYPRVGRGAVAILDVASNDELHRLLTQWLDFVPVHFDIYPLASPEEAQKLLR